MREGEEGELIRVKYLIGVHDKIEIIRKYRLATRLNCQSKEQRQDEGYRTTCFEQYGCMASFFKLNELAICKMILLKQHL